MNTLISTENLCKCYGKFVSVNNLDLSVPAECIYGFLGPNGAGKSTTLKMILGLAKPTKGSISLFGETVTNKNLLPALRKTGSLIESPSYYEHLSGEENLRIAAALKEVDSKQIAEILDIVKLTDFKDRKVKNYSLGMKQRLGFATALLGFPQLLILDEPTNGLDPAGIQEMRELILSLPKQFGMTIVVSSHLLSEIDQIANYVGIINHGNLLFQGSLNELHSMSRGELFLRTNRNTDAAQFLSDLHVPVRTQNDVLVLPALPDSEIALYLKGLWEAGFAIYRLEGHEKSLEDIFLTITEGDVHHESVSC